MTFLDLWMVTSFASLPNTDTIRVTRHEPNEVTEDEVNDYSLSSEESMHKMLNNHDDEKVMAVYHSPVYPILHIVTIKP